MSRTLYFAAGIFMGIGVAFALSTEGYAGWFVFVSILNVFVGICLEHDVREWRRGRAYQAGGL